MLHFKLNNSKHLTLIFISFLSWMGLTTKTEAVQNAVSIVYGWDNGEPKILLAHESKMNGQWVLPGGKINQNELLYDAAKRELYEETAAQPLFDPNYFPKKLQSKDITNYSFPKNNPHTQIFVFEVNSIIDISDNGKWCTRAQAKKSPYYLEMDNWKWVSHFEAFKMIQNGEVKYNTLQDFLNKYPYKDCLA